MGGSSPYERIKFENAARIFLNRQRQHEATKTQQQHSRLYHLRLIADTTPNKKSALYFLSIVVLSLYIFNLIYLGISVHNKNIRIDTNSSNNNINIAHHQHRHPAGIATITSAAAALSSKDVTIDNEKEESSSIYQQENQKQEESQKQYKQNQKQIKEQELNFISNQELNDRDYFSDTFLLSRKRFLELDSSRIKTVEAATMVASNDQRGHPYSHSKMFVDWTDFNVEHMSKYWNMLGLLDSNDPNQLLDHLITTFYEPYIKRSIMDENENTKKTKTTIMSNTIAMIAFMPYSYNRRKSLFINKTPEGIQRGKVLTSYSLAATIASLWSSGPFGRIVIVGLNESDQQYTIEACTILQKLSSSAPLSDNDSSSSLLSSIIVDSNNNNNNNRKSTLVDDNDASLPRTTVILSSSSSSSSSTVNSSIAEIIYTPAATYDNSRHNNDDGGGGGRGRGGNSDYNNNNDNNNDNDHHDIVVDQKEEVIIMDIAHIHVTDPTLYESKFMKFNVPRAAVVGMQQALLVGQNNNNNTGHHHDKSSLNWLGTRHIVYNNDNNNSINDTNNSGYWKYIVLIEPDTIMNINHNLLPKIKQALDDPDGSISLFPHRLHPLPHASDLPINTTLNRGLYLPNVPELYVTTLMTKDPTDGITSTVTTTATATDDNDNDNDGPYISCCDDGGNYPIGKPGGGSGGAPSSPCPQKIINGQNSGGGSNKWYLCGFREIDNDGDDYDDDDDYNGGGGNDGDDGDNNKHIQQKHIQHNTKKPSTSTITTNEQILKGHENILKYKMMRLNNGLGVVFGSSNQGRRCLPSKIPCPIT